HSVEDICIAIGEAFKNAIGDKKGIRRYSNIYIPKDESVSMVAIDISNRPYLVFNAKIDTQMIGSMSTQCFKEFFRAFVNESRVTLHINLLYGENDHHKIESIFKALAN
ncbi:imidazoleglycerol-phosphate dehydratase, partial [Clostridioides difficile]|nr:imidazoleglycerol-phosphate dehydratase [Clostridioides difficile]